MNPGTVRRIAVPIAGLLGLLLAVKGWRVASRQFEAPAESVPSDSTAQMVEKGRALYRGSGTCFVCHGPQLEGGVGPTLRAHVWKDAKAGDVPAIYAVVTHGVPNTAMVAHPGGISDVQALQLATYVWAVSHDAAKP